HLVDLDAQLAGVKLHDQPGVDQQVLVTARRDRAHRRPPGPRPLVLLDPRLLAREDRPLHVQWLFGRVHIVILPHPYFAPLTAPRAGCYPARAGPSLVVKGRSYQKCRRPRGTTPGPVEVAPSGTTAGGGAAGAPRR